MGDWGRRSEGGSVEDHGAVGAEEDAVIEDEAEGTGEDELFDVASGLAEVFGGVGMVHGDDLLDDDGALVEIGGDEVGGGADDLHAAVEGLVIGAGAGEGGEEGVMDVDDATGEAGDEGAGEDPHVLGENEEFGGVLGESLEEGGFVGIAVEAGVGDMVEGEIEAADEGFEFGMVGDDGKDLGVQLSVSVADEEVGEAVMFAGGEDDDLFGAGCGQADGGVGGEDSPGCGEEGSGIDGAIELGPHEEAGGRGVHEFMIADDVGAVGEEDAGDGVDEAGLVTAFDEEDVVAGLSGGHGVARRRSGTAVGGWRTAISAS